jgi:hypothetical protein
VYPDTERGIDSHRSSDVRHMFAELLVLQPSDSTTARVVEVYRYGRAAPTGRREVMEQTCYSAVRPN